jgi:hypothetical protein
MMHNGALKAAVLYQLLILIILWLNKDKVIQHQEFNQFGTCQQPRFVIIKLFFLFVL